MYSSHQAGEAKPTGWDAVLNQLIERIGNVHVDVWFSRSQMHLDGRDVVIEAASSIHRDWIRDNFRDDLEQAVHHVFPHGPGISIVSAEERKTLPDPVATAPVSDSPDGLDPEHTFESFIVGSCNEFAHAAALNVAREPARNYNPLFIYGSTGLGKTHLCHAIGNRIREADSSARIVYVTAEHFTNELIHALQTRRMEDLRTRYREHADVLIVDDIQFIGGKERTQEEFFFTFNALQARGSQVILTSDVEPSAIKGLEPRLRTRFEGGLLADMQAPDYETLTAIMNQFADQHGVMILPEVSDAICASVAGSIRELLGAINTLKMIQAMLRRPVDLEEARKRMPKLLTPPKREITTHAVIDAVARAHNIRAADITGKRRTRTLTEPRHIAMFLARKHTGLSFPELGREFGNRDHSTVQHGVKRIKNLMEKSVDLQYRVRLIEEALQRA